MPLRASTFPKDLWTPSIKIAGRSKSTPFSKAGRFVEGNRGSAGMIPVRGDGRRSARIRLPRLSGDGKGSAERDEHDPRGGETEPQHLSAVQALVEDESGEHDRAGR